MTGFLVASVDPEGYCFIKESIGFSTWSSSICAPVGGCPAPTFSHEYEYPAEAHRTGILSGILLVSGPSTLFQICRPAYTCPL